MPTDFVDITVGTLNCAYWRYATTLGAWPGRIDRLADLVKKAGISAIALQEVDTAACRRFTERLGWQYERSVVDADSTVVGGLNAVAWNPKVFSKGSVRDNLPLPSPARRHVRSLVLVKLTHKKSGLHHWAGSTHLTTNKDAGNAAAGTVWRGKQAAELGTYLSPFVWLWVGGDLNSSSTGALSARGVAGRAGLTATSRTSIDEVLVKTTDSKGRASAGMQLLGKPSTVDTGTASDHDLIVARIRVNRSKTPKT